MPATSFIIYGAMQEDNLDTKAKSKCIFAPPLARLSCAENRLGRRTAGAKDIAPLPNLREWSTTAWCGLAARFLLLSGSFHFAPSLQLIP
jgi:hypothetical protein